MPTGRAVAGLALAAVAAVVAAAAAAIATDPSSPPQRGAAGALPAPVTPAFTPGRPLPLEPARERSLWAPVRRRVFARSAPARAAAVVATVPSRTPEGTRNVVAVAARGADRAGRRWVRVRLAVLPNGSTGWVPRAALGGYGTVATRLDVDLQLLTATLYRDGDAVLTAPIGVGEPTFPTPQGRFYVRNKLTRYRSPVYGPVAFGTSARSPTATDWPAGGFVGIHGTDRPDLVPGRVSHGCIRMRNADILVLARAMPVGTPVVIR
jgi:lipoprotein-anchoring transpeptidase ErfK/SrfK